MMDFPSQRCMKIFSIKICLATIVFVLAWQFTVNSQPCSWTAPLLLGQQLTFPSIPLSVVADRSNKPYAYIAAKDGGLLIFDISDTTNPFVIDSLPIALFNSLHVMDVTQEGDFLFLALGNFFGSNLQQPGMAIIDVSNPLNAIILDTYIWPTTIKGSSIVIVENDFAYLGAMTNGLMIFDISNKSNIQFVSTYIPDINWPVVNPTASMTPNARGMAIQNDTVYLCYDAGGIRVVDVSDKLNPVQISQYINPAVLGKQQAYNDVAIAGNLAYVGVDYCGLEILDISDPTNITQVGWWNPWECELASNTWFNSPGHINQVVYDSISNAVLLSSGGSELSIVDVFDPAIPDSCNSFGVPGNQLAVWGLDYYKNNIFLNYINSLIPFFANWSGLKILNWNVNTVSEELTSIKPSISVFPNPAYSNSDIYINIACQDQISRVDIFDIGGRHLKKLGSNYKKPAPAGYQLKLPSPYSQATGMYIVRVVCSEEVFYSKFEIIE
jgi:hypothetical protein